MKEKYRACACRKKLSLKRKMRENEKQWEK